MAKIEITIPGERLVEEFTALVTQTTTPTTAEPVNVGLVEISQQQPTNLIPGPVGPQGVRGSRWYTGDGAPTVTGALLGDMYLDDISGDIWVWDGTAWVNTGTNMSPSGQQLMDELKTVDGAGSGLDADLLDGQHGAFYQDFANQTNKPATYPPTVPIPWTDVSSKPSTFPPTLPIAQSDVTGLVAGQAAQDTAINTKVGPDAPSDGLTYGRKNALWATIVGGAVVSDTAPAGPNQTGQFWYESDSGNTFLWVDNTWVQQNVMPTAPGPVLTGMQQTVIATSGTYTKPAGLQYLEVTVVGGGGGGASAGSTAASQASAGGGGGGGNTVIKLLKASDLAATVAMTIGAGGPGAISPISGSLSSFGSHATANGGSAGSALAARTTPAVISGGSGGSGSGSGDFNRIGGKGGYGWTFPSGTTYGQGGSGGDTLYGTGGFGPVTSSSVGGPDGTFPGGGGAGSGNAASQGTATGGNGWAGGIILKEYF